MVASFGITPGMRVMDVGRGEGTTVVPIAQLDATVTGIDISTPLVGARNKRVAELVLTTFKFQEGDPCNLEGVPDDPFDLSILISIFGAMSAPGR